MNEELKVKSFRATDEVYEKFKKIASEQFENQGQCLADLISLYELEKGKAIIPERKLELENFQAHMHTLTEMFLTSLQLNQDAELRVRSEFESQLVSKDKIIKDLQDKMETYKSKSNVAMEELKNIQTANKELHATIADQEHQINESIKKNQNLQEEFTVTIKDKEQLNAVLSDQCTELRTKVNDMQADYQSMKEQLTNLETVEQERNNLKIMVEKLESDIQLLQQQLTLENEKSLLKKEKQHQQEMEQLKNTYQSEIDKYQGKIETLLIRLEEKNEKKIVEEKPQPKKTSNKKKSEPTENKV